MNTPVHPARRRFLMGAAGIAAAPLVVGLAGCTTNAARQDSAEDVSGDSRPENTLTAATTVTSRRTLGALEVSGIGLGCQTMPGKLYGPVTSRADMITLIRTAHDQGVTFFDTAEAYGPLESERILGEALQPVRDQVVIASASDAFLVWSVADAIAASAFTPWIFGVGHLIYGLAVGLAVSRTRQTTGTAPSRPNAI